MADVIHELIATDAAIDKLGRRLIGTDEAEQLPRNRHAVLPMCAARKVHAVSRSNGGC